MSNLPIDNWQPPVLNRLEELLQQPLSYSNIATCLSQEFGVDVSKSATIAKAARMGLAHKYRNRPAVPGGRPRGSKTYRHPVKAVAPPKPKPRRQGHVELVQLDHTTCRWPMEDRQVPPFMFCGDPPVEGAPYCLAHCHRAYPAMGKH